MLSTTISILIQLSDGTKCLCVWAPQAQTQTFNFIAMRSAIDCGGTVVKHTHLWRRRDPCLEQRSPPQVRWEKLSSLPGQRVSVPLWSRWQSHTDSHIYPAERWQRGSRSQDKQPGGREVVPSLGEGTPSSLIGMKPAGVWKCPTGLEIHSSSHACKSTHGNYRPRNIRQLCSFTGEEGKHCGARLWSLIMDSATFQTSARQYCGCVMFPTEAIES